MLFRVVRFATRRNRNGGAVGIAAHTQCTFVAELRILVHFDIRSRTERSTLCAFGAKLLVNAYDTFPAFGHKTVGRALADTKRIGALAFYLRFAKQQIIYVIIDLCSALLHDFLRLLVRLWR